jgi:hypothetical protein
MLGGNFRGGCEQGEDDGESGVEAMHFGKEEKTGGREQKGEVFVQRRDWLNSAMR